MTPRLTSYALQNWAWEVDVSRQARLVLLCLVKFADPANGRLEVHPSIATIADLCDYAVKEDGTCSAVSDRLAELERLGHIKSRQRGEQPALRHLNYRPAPPKPSVTAERKKPPPTTEPYATPQATPYRPSKELGKPGQAFRGGGRRPGAWNVIPIRIADPDFPDALPAKPCVCGGRPGSDGNCSKCGRQTGRAAA